MPKKCLVVIAQNGFQDTELEGTRRGLTEADFEVVLASKEAGTCTGKFGGQEEAALAIRDVNVNEYDRIAFIGGPGAHILASDPEALKLARETVAALKPLGAICVAPTILAISGVLDGKRATVWDNAGEQKHLLETHGATYTGDPVTIDGLIVTANGPEAAVEFGRQFASLAAL